MKKKPAVKRRSPKAIHKDPPPPPLPPLQFPLELDAISFDIGPQTGQILSLYTAGRVYELRLHDIPSKLSPFFRDPRKGDGPK